MKLIGLTGSIAMGKSVTADLFRQQGIAVFDADQTVHELYQKNGEAVSRLHKEFPSAIIDGAVDRNLLGKLVLNNKAAMARLEAIIHPLVRQKQQDFIAEREKRDDKIVILDIPLLFETGRQDQMDAIIVVSCPADIQKQRALSRPDMTEEKLAAILARQMPDAEKRKQADFIIDSSVSINHADDQVKNLIDKLTGDDELG